MGELQNNLTELLNSVGTLTDGALSYPRVEDVAASGLKDEIERVYRSLGGVLQVIPLNLCSWDIKWNGMAIELDECLHFNRYRSLTLKSGSYGLLRAFPLPDYLDFCTKYEDKCLRAGSYGKKWSSPSAEAQFGDASQPGDLVGNGSPRWKQRAFYDFVKDLSPLLINVTVVRVPVWDTVVESGRRRTVVDVLKSPSDASPDALAALIQKRVAG
jgi:hypothetical protein